MIFVEQEVDQSMVSCCLKEYDHLNTNFEAPSLALNTYSLNERGKFQDSLALDDSHCKSKFAISNGSLTRSENCSPVPRWMTPKPERQFNIRPSIKNGLVASMDIVEPQISRDFLHSHSRESMKPLSFPIMRTEIERLNDFGVGLQSTVDLFNSEHALQKQAPSIPLGFKPLEAPSRKEHTEDLRMDMLSFSIEKQQKHPLEGSLEVLPSVVPSLALSHPSENNPLKNSDVSSWVSKFPFLIRPDKDVGESVDLVRSAFQGQFLEPSNVLNSIRNCASQLADTKNYVDQSNLLIQHPPSLVGLKSGHIQANVDSITSKCASTGPDIAFVKRDWNTKLGASVKVPQTSPGFFFQQKGMKAVKPNFFGDPEICLDVKGNGVISEDLSSRFGGETAERNRKPTIIVQKMEQQELACGSPAQEKLSHDFSLEMTEPSVKFQASAVTQCAQSASMDSRWENVKTDLFEAKYGRPARQAASQLSCAEFDVNKLLNNGPATESMPLAKCTSSQMGGNSFHTLASVPLYRLAEKSSVLEGLADTTVIPEIEWNEFLAASTTREVTGSPIKIMLPFEQRFQQLQGFLKKCDHSDMEYFQRAFHMLSANEEGNHAVELTSRALRLSLEEGKEIKRAKLLNMLDESPELPFLASSTSSTGPYFLSFPIVKESA